MKKGTYCGGVIRFFVGVMGPVVNPILHLLPGNRRTPELKEYTLEVRWWPLSANDFRIAFLSDFHLPSGRAGIVLFEQALDRLKECRPDLVLLGGDFVNSLYSRANQEMASYSHLLQRLSAPSGVFAVLGNHDWRLAPVQIQEMLLAGGVQVLENQSVKIPIPGGSFHLVGIGDCSTRHSQVQKALPSRKNEDLIFAFTHNPDIFPKLPHRVKVLFAGHTHGGQVRLPLIGPLFTGIKNRRYCLGMFRENGQTLIVSGGVGCSSLDLRLGLPAEVTLLKLFAKGK